MNTSYLYSNYNSRNSEMMTHLGYIGANKKFPPAPCNNRLEQYNKNFNRFDGDYNKDKSLTVMTYDGTQSYNIKMFECGDFKHITNKFLSLILNEKPLITLNNDEDTEALNTMLDNVKFYEHLASAMQSFSMLGDAVFYVFQSSDGFGGLNVVNPQLWFKIVDQCNINNTVCHVLWQPLFKFDDATCTEEIKYARVMECYTDRRVTRVYSFDGVTLGSPVAYDIDGVTVPVDGLVEFGVCSVFSIHNSKPINSVYGVSDYNIVSDAVEYKEKTLTIKQLLNEKNGLPLLLVPQDFLRVNEATKKVEFKAKGNMLSMGNNGVKPEFLTADVSVEHFDSLLEQCNNEIAIKSEYGKQFLYGDYSSTTSGEQVKLIQKSAMDKVSRQIDSFNSTIKDVICTLAHYHGLCICHSDLTIEWQDGVSTSDETVASVITTRYSGGTMSLKRALMRFDGLTSAQADEEILLINETNESKVWEPEQDDQVTNEPLDDTEDSKDKPIDDESVDDEQVDGDINKTEEDV